MSTYANVKDNKEWESAGAGIDLPEAQRFARAKNQLRPIEMLDLRGDSLALECFRCFK